MRCSANIKLGKLVELDVDLVLGAPLALRLDFLRLWFISMNEISRACTLLTCSNNFADPPLATILLAKLRAEEKFLLLKASFIAADRTSWRCATSSLGIVK